MTGGGFFNRLFGSPTKSVEMDEIKANKIVEGAQKIVAAYGDVLANKIGVVQDIKELPYQKDQIKLALKILLKLTTDVTMQNHLRSGYVTLGDFQELSDTQAQALQVWNSITNKGSTMTQDEIGTVAREISRVGKIVMEVETKAVAEAESLYRELNETST
jgi:hypothetical protein